MEQLGISDIQKNIGLIKNLHEAVEIIDKRLKKTIAIIYPVNKTLMADQLAGKYKGYVRDGEITGDEDLSHAKEQALFEAWSEKYKA